MIEIEYCLFPMKDGIPNILPNSLLSVWEYLYSIYQNQHITIAIDIEYLLQKDIPPIVDNTHMVVDIPPIDIMNPSTQRSTIDGSLQKEILRPSLSSLVNQQLSIKEGKTRRKRKNRKLKKEEEEEEDDDDWKMRPRKKRNTKKKLIEGDLFNDNDLNWKEPVMIIIT